MCAAVDRTSRLRGPDLLRAIAEGTAGEVGDEFLRGLVRTIAEAFGAKFVFVAEADEPDLTHVRVVAGWYDRALWTSRSSTTRTGCRVHWRWSTRSSRSRTR